MQLDVWRDVIPLRDSKMPTIELITQQNAMKLKNVRLRALQDAPTAFSSTYAAEFQLTDAEWLKRAARWTDETSIAYLAVDAGSACGIAAGFLDKNDATRAHLVSMWVAPTHRRRGIGQELVDKIVDWARLKSARTLMLLVTSNNHPAIGFYQQLGFRMTGWTEPYANDSALSNLAMIRSIS
jgi:ribosomal protein S18 acetylase RimI-like enzyme